MFQSTFKRNIYLRLNELDSDIARLDRRTDAIKANAQAAQTKEDARAQRHTQRSMALEEKIDAMKKRIDELEDLIAIALDRLDELTPRVETLNNQCNAATAANLKRDERDIELEEQAETALRWCESFQDALCIHSDQLEGLGDYVSKLFESVTALQTPTPTVTATVEPTTTPVQLPIEPAEDKAAKLLLEGLTNLANFNPYGDGSGS